MPLHRWPTYRWIVLAVLLAASWAWLPAQAQPAPALPAAKSPVSSSATPADAQQAIDLLRDDKRRAEFLGVLETIAKAAPAAGPSQALPLEPDSLIAQIINGAGAALVRTGAQVAAAIHAVNDLPLLWRWIVTQATDAEFRARLLDALWKVAVATGAGLAAEFVVHRVLRRMRAALGSWTPATSPYDGPADHRTLSDERAAEADLAMAEADKATSRDPRKRLNAAAGTLRRLPYLLGLLLLDLAPIAVFAAVATLMIGTRIGEPLTTRRAIQLVLGAYAGSRIVLAITSMLVTPASPQLRLLHVSEWAAGFLTGWTRRVLLVAVTGYVLAEIGLLFNMYQTAHDALLKLFALVVHGMLITAVLQARPHVAARIRAPHRLHGVWAAILNRIAEIWHLVAVFFIAALWLVWAAELRNGYVRLIHFCLVTFGVILAARLLGVVLLGGLDRALRFSPDTAARHPGLAERASIYQPLLRASVTAVLCVATGLALLEVWNLGPVDWLVRNGLGGRVVSAVTLITVTIVLAALVWEGANAAIEHHIARLTAEAHLARAGRLRTLLPMLRTTLLVTIVLVVALMILSELGINIAPLLAGAGVIGIAIGFGSQKLVQDLITGLFLLIENAMQVGDVVTLGGLTGTVEALSIRTIRLRALDGAVHIIPFSAVTTVTNQTRDYGYAVLDISVGLNEEPDRIIGIVRGLADAMRTDPQWAPLILDALDVMGVEKFIDTAWVLRVRLKTQPASRWKVGRELNRRVKLLFDELAIESPLTAYRSLSSAPAAA